MPIIHSRLDTDTLPEPDRFGLFRAALNASHDAHRVDNDARPFRAQLDAWLLGDLVITGGNQMAVRMVRTPDRIRDDGFDYVTLMHLREGSVGGLAGRRFECRTGEVLVLDLSQPMDVISQDCRNFGLRIPRTLLSPVWRRLSDLHGWVFQGLAAQLLGEHLAALERFAPRITPEELPLLARATAALVGSCVVSAGPHRAEAAQGRELALRQRVIEHIDAHLGDVALTADSVKLALGLSRSSLYRLFADGGLASTIRERRLNAAYAALSDPAETRTIGQVARAFGFRREAHFSQAFSHRFGHAPRLVAARRGGRPAGETGPDRAYSAWLAGLHGEAGLPVRPEPSPAP